MRILAVVICCFSLANAAMAASPVDKSSPLETVSTEFGWGRVGGISKSAANWLLIHHSKIRNPRATTATATPCSGVRLRPCRSGFSSGSVVRCFLSCCLLGTRSTFAGRGRSGGGVRGGSGVPSGGSVRAGGNVCFGGGVRGGDGVLGGGSV